MKKIVKRLPLFIVSGTLLVLGIFLSRPAAIHATSLDVRVIEITAKKYEYSNSPIHVKAGTKVQLKITATDHDHGFKIDNVPDGRSSGDITGLIFTTEQECWQLKKGETTLIEFLPRTAGTYTFRCCHTCGLGHRSMKGQLVVEP
jgi:cytochrome c oxidase subunit 2